MINPDYLRTFLVLVETNHFTRTAEKLHMTQPGVSQHIQKLENHFKSQLLRREGKKFTLTESGRLLVEYGKKLFQDYQTLENSISVDDPFLGVCRYSSPGSFGFHLLDVLNEAAKLHQGLDVCLTVAPNSSVPNLLLERKIDVGFMTEEPVSKQLEALAFHKEELLLLVPQNFKMKDFHSLIELGFVDHPDGIFLATRLLKLNFPNDFESLLKVRRRVFINQISRILDPVAMGLGFTVLPQGAYLNYQSREKLKVVRLKKIVFDQIFHVTRKGESLPSRYQTIEKMLVSKLKKI